MLPVIALIGRPNVGKSTLFNRLTRSRDAIVADYTASNEWGCSVEGRYIMEQMMPARLAGLFELDPWCEAPPEAIEEVFAKV